MACDHGDHVLNGKPPWFDTGSFSAAGLVNGNGRRTTSKVVIDGVFRIVPFRKRSVGGIKQCLRFLLLSDVGLNGIDDDVLLGGFLG